MKLASASNLMVPAYLSLKSKGYEISCKKLDDGKELWFANKDGNEFVADEPIMLLGVVGVFEARGENWAAPDELINKFLEEFGE